VASGSAGLEVPGLELPAPELAGLELPGPELAGLVVPGLVVPGLTRLLGEAAACGASELAGLGVGAGADARLEGR
jgi:hypothetical protein